MVNRSSQRTPGSKTSLDRPLYSAKTSARSRRPPFQADQPAAAHLQGHEDLQSPEGLGHRNADVSGNQRMPEAFSTDLAVHTAADPNFSLMAVATHFMSFGLSVEDCLGWMTVNPARVLRHPELGTLAAAGVWDATLLRIERGTFRLSDADGRARTTARRLVAVAVFCAGKYVGITPPPAG